ncbi:MAG: hypothetical protein AB8G05_22870 [Oligoflexales bacterium]
MIGIILMAPNIGASNLPRNLGVVKKRRSSLFSPPPKEECKALGAKKIITYYIESIEGCPQANDKANLIGPSISLYIAELSKKWRSTDFKPVEDQEEADFIIRLGNDSNLEFNKKMQK